MNDTYNADTQNGTINSSRPVSNDTGRQSNFELLRILAMLLIIGHHFSVHGGFKYEAGDLSLNRLWIMFLEEGGKIGVDLFVMISGFFLIKADTSVHKLINKALTLWQQAFFYKTGIFAVFCAAGIITFSVSDLVSCFLPVTTGWWFVRIYFILFLLSPFINRLLLSLTRREHKAFLILTGAAWCILPTFLQNGWGNSNLALFISLYSLAAYIRIYNPADKLSLGGVSLAAVACYFITFLCRLLLSDVTIDISVFSKIPSNVYNAESIFIVLTSLFIFLAFSKLKIPHNKAINIIASATFGIYLMHDDQYTRKFLWTEVFRDAEHSESSSLIPYSLFAIAAVFIVCGAFELMRRVLIERLISRKPTERVTDRICRLISKIS